MAPTLIGTSTLFLDEASRAAKTVKSGYLQPEVRSQTQSSKTITKDQNQYKWHIVWRNVIFFIYLHYAGLYGLYLLLTQARWYTVLFGFFYALLGGHGITMGAHRLWAHKTYKANLPLRIILAFCQTLAFQNHIYEWVRDHRVHHKFTDTDADPHNSQRGFFFSHMGWLIIKKHKDVMVRGATVDMSDLKQDGVVMFQKKYYMILMPFCTFMLPTIIPWYFWNEDLLTAWYVSMFRYAWSLHSTWLVNSAAHIYGMKPYDKTMSPTENKLVSALAIGEGWHNYHHVFPWDYKAGEFGFNRYNITAGTIDLFSKLGWAWDLKTVSDDMIRRRALRTGDGSKVFENVAQTITHTDDPQDTLWGWGDKDMSRDAVQCIRQFNKLRDD